MPVVTLPWQLPPIEIDPDHPVARLVERADTAYAEGRGRDGHELSQGRGPRR